MGRSPTLPAKDIHLSQAKHNFNHACLLTQQTTVHMDWVCTGLFYTGLHYVDAYLDFVGGEHPRSHRSRRDILNGSGPCSIVGSPFQAYSTLEQNSKIARYDCKFCISPAAMLPILQSSVVKLDEIVGWINSQLPSGGQSLVDTLPAMYRVDRVTYYVLDFQ